MKMILSLLVGLAFPEGAAGANISNVEMLVQEVRQPVPGQDTATTNQCASTIMATTTTAGMMAANTTTAGMMAITTIATVSHDPFEWKLENGQLHLSPSNPNSNPHMITADWLRQRCSSTACVDSFSKQPLTDSHQIGETWIEHIQEVSEQMVNERVADSGITFEGPTMLQVTFTDNIASYFSTKYLLREIEHIGSAPMQGPQCELPDKYIWDRHLHSPPVVDYMDADREADTIVSTLFSSGILLIDNVPHTENFCSEFGQRFSTLRDTEWGRVFNVKTQPDSNANVTKQDLAYTPLAIGLHTDNVYRDPMPDFQLLHQIDGCTCPDDIYPCDMCATANTFSDGFGVAQQLYDEDRDMFKILTMVNVRWENNGGDGATMMLAYKPVIEVDQNMMKNNECSKPGSKKGAIIACLTAIRHSAKSGGYAPLLDPERSALYFKALRRFSTLLSDEKNTIVHYLRPGQLVMFDNKRILHARSTVVSNRPRWLQGCYINHDGLRYKFCRSPAHQRESWTSLDEAKKEDFELVGKQYMEHVDNEMLRTFNRMLHEQKGNSLGQPVDLFTHGLQTATRTYRAGEEEDIVVMSLFHDVTESIVAKNHGGAAAALLEPYVSPKAIWMLRNHEVFQGYYYFHHFGGNRELRQKHTSHEHYQSLIDWCAKYDQKSFDPSYPSLPVSFFKPIVDRVFKRKPYWWAEDHPLANAVTGGSSADM